MKVLITGASSPKCGSVLQQLETCGYDCVLFDCAPLPEGEPTRSPFIQGDLNDAPKLRKALKGCNAVVHFAAYSAVDNNWGEIKRANVDGTFTLIRIAIEEKVERIVFASSNHVMGLYEQDNQPHIFEVDDPLKLDKDTPPRPDSLYGVSKLLNEQFGRYMAENGGPKFYAIRIGTVLSQEHDHPYALAEEDVAQGLYSRNSEPYELKVKRSKGTWLSRRDLLQLVDRCLQYEGKPFDIFYGISNNPRGWVDIEYAKNVLGYQPKDNAECWVQAPAKRENAYAV